MFGIIRPCGDHGSPSLRAAWRAHLCGLCLTLRDGHGHGARLTTNYDTLLLSVLTEAQLPAAAPRRTAGPCALRGFRPAEVVDARAEGARLAAAVSLVLTAGRLRDHVADGDAAFGTAAARRRLAARWEAGGARLGAGVGFDTAVLAATVDRQLDLERLATAPPASALRYTPGRDPGHGPGHGAGPACGLSVLDLTAPAEDAVAAAFAHTAVLAGRPGNAPALAEAGRFFGRIAHLLDAAEDQHHDDARGAFNPLTATATTAAEARRLCDDAAHGLTLALADVDLAERHLVDVLLGTEVRRAVTRTFGSVTASYERPGWIRKSAAGVATFWTCGMWRPRWSRRRGRPSEERCYLRKCGECCDGECCSCCDCS
ncbi:hypothetical protein E1295_45230 [Nonomuraea mesophila]|uniref:Uncharacterized protein n=1 Tax=Nonomuraea mesophila TaxID=2530382 RepID=A0A4R5E5B1_9ACTN|nr:DUF5685 family protein [Nonomuraea mesophila]TDE24989.1 hypothetical protein E1295_45230 [Nonomuraea mesophila]